MKKKLTIVLLGLALVTTIIAQENTEHIKDGWSFGALPAVSFNADQGFQYGALVNFFNYGNGSRYPKFDHSFYLELSRYTKGGGINRFYYQSDQLIPGITFGADISYLTEKAMDFWGFNGYDAVYNNEWENDAFEGSTYKSRMFYKHQREMFRIKTDFIIPSEWENWNYLAGLSFYDIRIAPIDISIFKNDLPDIDGLYDKYVDWGLITNKEKDGGALTYLKLGMQYDTRVNLANPQSGMWSEAMIRYSPSVASNNFDHSVLTLLHHQYIPIKKNKLTLAIRLGLQHALHGETPFYALPMLATSQLRSATNQGLGGGSTLRGILRNKIVGPGFALSNIELRYKPISFTLGTQNFYIGTNLFYDAGMITQARSINYDLVKSKMVNDNYDEYFSPNSEKLHSSLGLGFYLAMNENFVLAMDYGKALNKQDGTSGLYINLNYLF